MIYVPFAVYHAFLNTVPGVIPSQMLLSLQTQSLNLSVVDKLGLHIL